MKLIELLNVMNVADVEVVSYSLPGFCGAKKVNMRDMEHDPVVVRYGQREVVRLTNICKLGDTIEIR